eukprot:8996018-Alexandrium_andersonii.AAC.1
MLSTVIAASELSSELRPPNSVKWALSACTTGRLLVGAGRAAEEEAWWRGGWDARLRTHSAHCLLYTSPSPRD